MSSSDRHGHAERRRSTSARRRAIFEDAIRVVATDYAQPLTLGEVAARVYTSPRQLQRAFAEAGHMFAGWITFSALKDGGQTVVQAQVLMRASDPIYEIGLTLGGHRQEDRFWNATLTNLAGHFGHTPEVDTKVVCVDGKRQWSRWRNVWHSAAIRSTAYTLGTPARAIRRALRRDPAVG